MITSKRLAKDIALKIILSVFFATVGMLVISLIATAIQYSIGDFYLEHILKRVSISETKFYHRINLLEWYISSLSLVSGLISLTISIFSRLKYSHINIYWLVFGLLLLFMSLDKSIGLHHAIVHDLMYRTPMSVANGERLLKYLKTTIPIILILFYLPYRKKIDSLYSVLILSGFGCLIAAGQVNRIAAYLESINDVSNYLGILSLLFFEQFVEMAGATVLVFGLLLRIAKDVTLVTGPTVDHSLRRN